MEVLVDDKLSLDKSAKRAHRILLNSDRDCAKSRWLWRPSPLKTLP